jgi:hypothetical protein
MAKAGSTDPLLLLCLIILIDSGHPGLFDCTAWCAGEGASGGAGTESEASPYPESAF